MSIHACHKKGRVNPHTIWAIFCSVFIIAVIVLMGAGTWYFVETTRRLDAPVIPTLSTNAAKIQEIQQTLDIVEKGVQKRVAQ